MHLVNGMTDDAAEIAAYVAARNEMLMKNSVDALITFNRKHGNPEFSSRASAEVTMHKLRTAAATLPREVRQYSYRWLIERGFTSLDDGDLR